MTREKLAAICNVSRQSISKWEADIALSETDELLLQGETFHISMDVLLNGELPLSKAKEIWYCGNNTIQEKNRKYIVFKDKIIKYQIVNQAEKERGWKQKTGVYPG